MKVPRLGNRLDASVEMTPLIDVVFLLLIFFMVSTTFIRETQLKIDLPEAAGELQKVESQSLEVSISRDGEYSVDGRLLVNSQLKTLLRALREASGGDLKTRLIVTADAEASHQSVVRAMDAAGQIGLTRISITTQNPDDDDD
ncbi:MAG: biopolymer transporter ExbD [Pseudomonadota bacterium]